MRRHGIYSVEYFFDTLAMQVIDKHPNYHIFKSNCQNFAKFLLELFCPLASIPDSIYNALTKLQDISIIVSALDCSIPRAWPLSITTNSTSLMNSSGITWVTIS